LFLLRMGTSRPRNMSRIVMWHTCCYWIVH